MDREQEEMQFLGLLDIYVDSYKVLFSWRKLFSKITLALILPLSFIYLAHMEISDLLFKDIMVHNNQLVKTQPGSSSNQKLSSMVSADWTYYWLFTLAYLMLYVVLSLVSTAAVVYTIACIYTSKEVSFRQVLSIVPKVWKRLMVTFFCMFIFLFHYYTVSAFVLLAWVFLVGLTTNVGFGGFFVLLGIHSVGVIYLSIIWQLASVVSVLEDACGVKAMVKSRALIKGKMWVVSAIFFMLNVSFLGIYSAFQVLVVYGVSSSGILARVCIGFACLLLLSKLFLFGLVINTITYLVCKSYHHENIDKSALSGHLEVYLGEYVPLKTKDVQLENYTYV